MKKQLFIAAAVCMVLLSACAKKNEDKEQAAAQPDNVLTVRKTEPEETWTMPETSKYTIPADAETGEFGGPGAMKTTAVDYSYYPESKRPHPETEEEQGTLVVYYREDFGGVFQDFDLVETCDADSLIQLLTQNGVLTEGTVVKDFEINDRSGKLVLNKIEGAYNKSKEEQLVACIVNTFLDNFMLSELELTIGDKEYGVMLYNGSFAAT